MNKADKIFIVVVVLVSVLAYVPLIFGDLMNQGKQKEVVVDYKNKEVLREDLRKNAIYTLSGTLGDVFVEVQDEAVRVEKENSPYHLCSIQGWVEDTGRPIICLPNEMVIQIEAKEDTEHGVDTVLQ